jgi:hypothetical protein
VFRAKTGITTNADQGCSTRVSRSIGKNDAPEASPSTRVGVRRPSSTPATVACTPDARVATQTAIPTNTYAA